jgi:hypothetical protein
MSRTGWFQRYRVAGADPAADARIASITTDYLSTIALLRGRGFNLLTSRAHNASRS